ncbi:concanavalin A-like lectin/glucanase domain-containing protein [Artemisia annua]|uniref:Concanavalin A-like lectin/glucanase domain-containing protein n=1 Tax=Artemisia annua TaxID=35608 RepID=A0A2U1NYZ5_ARTAN|nr:concanavalin A-like lectin/glucanase domain-containing protein [Artemisia annua]
MAMVYLLTTTIILLHTLPYAAALSFQKNGFSPNDGDIIYERDAYPSNNAIQLTTNQRDVSASVSIGRATYSEPFHLWDHGSRNLSDFSTRFTFTINSLNSSKYGDGVAFFLAPNGSRIPDNVKSSGTLGLTSDDQALNSSGNPFVAVEFDVFKNKWDPEKEHVGIDISSMESVKNLTWRSRIEEGEIYTALIRYDASLNNLSVVFTGFSRKGSLHQRVSYIVDLREHLPEWVTFGFSGATGDTTVINSIYKWAFSSNLGIKESTMDPEPGTAASPRPEPKPEKSKSGQVIGLVVGIVSFIGLGLGLFMLRRRKRFETKDDIFVLDSEFEKGTGAKKFSYKELARATSNFAEREKLGEGGFGGVYKGFVKEMDSYVAVKRVSRESHQGVKEYASEVKTISQLRHRNLVQLVGWCHEKKELLLVYEFMLNGSLDSHLFYNKSMLRWPVRYNIAKGLGSALLYLHAEWEKCVVHRDIKSSNVMLDSNFNAKLGDFGLARFVDHDKGSQTTVIAGTMGYMAPECVMTGQASRETDVYSFGVVALEIACGRKPMELKAEKGQIRIVEWVWDLYGQRRVLEAADSRLEGDYNQNEMERLMTVGLWCAHPDSGFRPSIREALSVLNFQSPLPNLPVKMPVPTYFTPFSNFQVSSDSQTSHTQSSIYGYTTDSTK